MNSENSSLVMMYASGAAWTFAHRCDSAPSRMLLMVGSAAPSGDSRAISSACVTTGSTAGLGAGAIAGEAEAMDEGVEMVGFGVGVPESEAGSPTEGGFVEPLML